MPSLMSWSFIRILTSKHLYSAPPFDIIDIAEVHNVYEQKAIKEKQTTGKNQF